MSTGWITFRGVAWMLKGKCATAPRPDDWFPDWGTLHRGHQTGARRAELLCKGCPVEARCLDYAMGVEAATGHELAGIWGGTTPTQRRAAHLRAERNAAA